MDTFVSEQERQTSEIISELEDMTLDPTLDQCCRRDIQSRIEKERVRQCLQQQDRIDARQRTAAAAYCRDPAALAGLQHASAEASQAAAGENSKQNTNMSNASCAASDDPELQELRMQRLRQLQAQSAVHQEQQKAGFGSLNDVQESKLLALICEPPGRGLLVVHLAVQGYEPCNTLDECLEAAAAQYRGTYFARVVVARGSSLVSQLQLPHGVPALLVGRDGCLVGKAHISQFGGHDIWEEEVMSYLRRFKVLAAGSSSRAATAAGSGQPGSLAAAAAGGRSGAGSSSDVESDTGSDGSKGGDDWRAPCEVCGRMYPHTHVRAIYSKQQNDDSEEEE